MMTIAEYYIEEGRKEGREQGRDEERRALARELLREGTCERAFIARICHLSHQELARLASEISQ